MRNRLEDIGRIMVILEKILDLPLFEEHSRRDKDFLEWLDSLSKEKREDFLYKIPYQIREVSDQLTEAILIARGHDFLNEQTKD